MNASIQGAIKVGVRRGYRIAFPAAIYPDGSYRRLGDGSSTRNPRRSAKWWAKRLRLPLEEVA